MQVLINIFTRFLRKHLCQIFLFTKIAVLKPEPLFRKRPLQMFPCEFQKTFKNIYFVEQMHTAAITLEETNILVINFRPCMLFVFFHKATTTPDLMIVQDLHWLLPLYSFNGIASLKVFYDMTSMITRTKGHKLKLNLVLLCMQTTECPRYYSPEKCCYKN